MSDDILIGEELEFVETDAGTIYSTIITALEKGVNEPLYPGDERRIYGEAVAAVFVSLFNTMNDVARQKMLRYARGNVLDALGQRTGTIRLESKPATATMRFMVSAPAPFDIVIPKWTKVTPDGNVYFATDSDAVLQAGSYSVDVPASSTGGGEKFNGYAVGTISTLVDLIPYITSVSNITTSSGGDDGEPYTTAGDNRYRERIRLSSAKLSTAGPSDAYIYWALTADPDIIDVKVESQAAGTVQVIPLMKGGNLPDEDTRAKVLAVVNDPAVRPLTDSVSVVSPTTVEYDIEVKYYTTANNEATVVETIEGEGGALDLFRSWQSAALGRDINPDYLRKLILAPDWEQGLTGAIRLDVIAPSYTSIGNTEVAKFSGVLNVTHEVIAGVV